MASFDIVSKVDLQTVDNAVNAARREMDGRYDFKGSQYEVELDKKNLILHLTAENEFRLEQMESVLLSRFIKNKLSPQSLDLSKEHYASGKTVRKDIAIKQGIDKDTARKIIKSIKDSKIKVDVAAMDDQVRVTSKNIDNLQAVIAHCRAQDFELPLQFTNMKSK